MGLPTLSEVSWCTKEVVSNVTVPRLLLGLFLNFAPLVLFRSMSLEPSAHHHLSVDLSTMSVHADLHWIWLGVIPVAGYVFIVLLTGALGIDDGENARQGPAAAVGTTVKEGNMAVAMTLFSQIFANMGVALLFHGGGLSFFGVIRGMLALDTIEYFTHRLMHEAPPAPPAPPALALAFAPPRPGRLGAGAVDVQAHAQDAPLAQADADARALQLAGALSAHARAPFGRVWRPAARARTRRARPSVVIAARRRTRCS